MTPVGAWLAALLVCVVAGLVLASSWFLAWPAAVLFGAGAAFCVGVVGFGVLAHADARREGVSSLRAARQGLSTAARAFLHLLP